MFRAALLAWYRRNARDLPWRKTNDPYRVWVSEIMLQQTQVDRVRAFYLDWMNRFPDVHSLARASWSDVLERWRGLGYYQRARNIMKTAKIITGEMRGAFPRDPAALTLLPGIGPYTAAAISSLAFNLPVPVLDTNAARVYRRVFSLPENAGRADYLRVAQASVSRRAPRPYNNAVMELGALVCTARAPACQRCPAWRTCASFPVQRAARPAASKTGGVGRRAAAPASSRRLERCALAAIWRGDRYLVAVRPAGKRLAGFHEFPGGKIEKGESPRACLKREVMEEIGVEVSVRPAFMVVEHRSGKTRVQLSVHRCRILSGEPTGREGQELRWVHVDALESLKMPKANRPIIERLRKFRRTEG